MNQVYPDLAEFLQQPAKPTRNATVEVQTDPDQTTAVSVALLNDIFEQLQLMMDVRHKLTICKQLYGID